MLAHLATGREEVTPYATEFPVAWGRSTAQLPSARNPTGAYEIEDV